MTPEQHQDIMKAWKKVEGTKQRITRAGEALKAAGLANADQARMHELNDRLQEAINADAEALEEVAGAMRAAGIDI